MNELISIIIPIYNTKDYLHQCINSVINQTYKNLEIILIDDGSTDKSGIICDEFALSDERIKVIHKKNEGQGVARNVGIDLAKGEYIGFVDSDDWIVEDMYRLLYETAVQYNSDVVACGSISVINDDEKDAIQKYKSFNYGKDSKISVIDNTERLTSQLGMSVRCSHSPIDKLYKKKLFDNSRFVEHRLYEDLASVYKFVANADKCIYIDECMYFYRDRLGSTMKNTFSIRQLDRITAYEDIESFLLSDPKYKDIVKYATDFKIGSIFYCVGELYLYKGNDNAKIARLLNEKAKEVLSLNKNISFKQKFLLILINLSPKIYGFVYNIKFKR